jgi:flagellar protein FlbD
MQQCGEETAVIRLTRINHIPLVLNSDLIEHVEVTPDTVISLTNGQKFVVLESLAEVIEQVVDFRRSILRGVCAHATVCPTAPNGGAPCDNEEQRNL